MEGGWRQEGKPGFRTKRVKRKSAKHLKNVYIHEPH